MAQLTNSNPIKSQPMAANREHQQHHQQPKNIKGHSKKSTTQNHIDREINLQQLSKHVTLESAWLSLNGMVYDVTTYIKYHPGGNKMLEGCGKQCIDIFNQNHPYVHGNKILSKYKLGVLKL